MGIVVIMKNAFYFLNLNLFWVQSAGCMSRVGDQDYRMAMTMGVTIECRFVLVVQALSSNREHCELHKICCEEFLVCGQFWPH